MDCEASLQWFREDVSEYATPLLGYVSLTDPADFEVDGPTDSVAAPVGTALLPDISLLLRFPGILRITLPCYVCTVCDFFDRFALKSRLEVAGSSCGRGGDSTSYLSVRRTLSLCSFCARAFESLGARPAILCHPTLGALLCTTDRI